MEMKNCCAKRFYWHYRSGQSALQRDHYCTGVNTRFSLLEGVERVVHGLLAKNGPCPALQPVGRGGAEAHASVTVLQTVVVRGGRGGRGSGMGGVSE